MKEYPKYPIYSFSARWSQDGVWDENYPNWHEGLPEGRVWNSTSFRKMFKEEQTQEQLDAFAKEWWEGYLKAEHRTPMINIEMDFLKAEYKEHETWVLTWFQHETFDVGQSDLEALDSFEQFVRRYERMQGQDIFYQKNYPEKYHCLMGAEDRYRWHGAEPDGKPDDHSPAPCRCKFCKEQGVIRIAH